MASQTNSYAVPEVVIGYPMQTSSATPPRCGWWLRPIVSIPPSRDRKATCKETTVCLSPSLAGLFTIAIMVILLHFINNAQCHAKFTIQSIAVSPSSPATWHVNFLVQNPSSRYSIDYGSDETAVSLGPLNAAVLNTYYERKSRSDTVFSVAFVAEGNSTDVVLEKLDISLRAKHKIKRIYGDHYPQAGLIEINCHNLTRSHENVEKIQCPSSFTHLRVLAGKHPIQ